MLDTIRVISPSIIEETYIKLKSISFEKLQIDNENNSIVYQFTNAELKGSFDSRIMVQIKTQKLDRYFSLDQGKYLTINKPCDPYLEIEFSIHKYFIGHNVFGGFNDLPEKFNVFIMMIEKQFNIVLPSFLEWTIKRLDYAEAFRLEDIENFFRYMKNCKYPRRKMFDYDTTIMFPGQTTTVRLYSKEHEFKAHDLKKLNKNKNIDIISILKESKNLLRVEVQLKRKKLLAMNGDKEMKIKDYNLSCIQEVYETEICKIFKLKEDRKLYNDTKSVLNVLYREFSQKQAMALFSTYTQISIIGQDAVKENMSKTTFYRHMKIFKDLCISVINTDLKIMSADERNPFSDFVPSLNSIYKVS